MAEDEQEQSSEGQDASTSASSRPAVKFSGSGGINVAVWKHKSDGNRDQYSIRLERSYKDDQGAYQSTPYLRAGDLLRAQKLLSQADDWIEQDRAKHRSSGAGRDQAVER